MRIPAAQNEVFERLAVFLTAVTAREHPDVHDFPGLVNLVGLRTVHQAIVEKEDVARLSFELLSEVVDLEDRATKAIDGIKGESVSSG